MPWLKHSIPPCGGSKIVILIKDSMTRIYFEKKYETLSIFIQDTLITKEILIWVIYNFHFGDYRIYDYLNKKYNKTT